MTSLVCASLDVGLPASPLEDAGIDEPAEESVA
jgi:hypothetical protein